MTSIREYIMQAPLLDHHCHGVVLDDLSRSQFEQLCTESSTPHHRSPIDAPFGLALRSECAPALGLERHATLDDYFARRQELGSAETARILMGDAGIDTLVVDTGYQGSEICSPQDLADISGAQTYSVARLEALAETVMPGSSAADVPARLALAVADAARSNVGFKSIIAYRYGLDFDPSRPTQDEVVTAAGAWMAKAEATATWRLDDPVIMRYLLYLASETAKPIQFHVGFGDSDAVQHRCNPSHLSEFLNATQDSGGKVMLLHCYPFIREAGILCHVFPHVFMDVGLAVNFLGPSAERAVAEALEIAPFGKQLFSTDAFGLPELYLTGSILWRRALASVLETWVAHDYLCHSDAIRYADWMARENAQHAYGLEGMGS